MLPRPDGRRKAAVRFYYADPHSDTSGFMLLFDLLSFRLHIILPEVCKDVNICGKY